MQLRLSFFLPEPNGTTPPIAYTNISLLEGTTFNRFLSLVCRLTFYRQMMMHTGLITAPHLRRSYPAILSGVPHRFFLIAPEVQVWELHPPKTPSETSSERKLFLPNPCGYLHQASESSCHHPQPNSVPMGSWAIAWSALE